MAKIRFRDSGMSTALFSALIATSSGVAAPALAQDVSASDDEYGDAIVVTARRREETLIEVPMAVSAFSAQALESQGITNISEIAQSAPSVTIEPSSPFSIICAASAAAPIVLVPVEPPHLRPSTVSSQRIAASEAASGTLIIASMTSGMKEGSQRGRPIPSIREGASMRSERSPLFQTS